jgi:hypothetical protein
MRNIEQWQPTKFVYERGKLIASRDSRQVGVASRIMANAIARIYEHYIPAYASGSLLDLGCGKAPLFGVYRKYADTITCVDWGESLHNNPYTDMLADLNGELPFPEPGGIPVRGSWARGGRRGQRRRSAFVVYIRHFELGSVEKQFHCKMSHAADAGC